MEPLAYLHGQLLPAAQACIPVYDAGVVLGATVTELTRTFRQKPFRLDRHLDRLFHSLGRLGLDIAQSPAELERIAADLIAHNAPLLDAYDDLGIVHFVTAGAYPTYAGMVGTVVPTTPTVCVHTFPLPFELWARKLQNGVHLVTPSIRQVPPECYDPSMKVRSRLHYYRADQEARRIEPGAQALLLDMAGNVTETAAANVFIVEGGTLVTPTLRNVLAGVSRSVTIELAGRLGITVIERDFPLAVAQSAEEIFLTSTPYCMLPATSLNGQPIGTGRPGAMFRRLLAAWSGLVGMDIEKQIVSGARRRGEN